MFCMPSSCIFLYIQRCGAGCYPRARRSSILISGFGSIEKGIECNFAMSWADSSPGMQAGRVPVNGHHPEEEGSQYPRPKSQRTKIIVVGLGMVGIAFMCVFHCVSVVPTGSSENCR